MKKTFLAIVSMVLLCSLCIPFAASANTDKTILTDEVLNSLTEEDYVVAYELIHDELYSGQLSVKEQNDLTIETLNNIYEKKNNRFKPFSLPVSPNNLNAAEKKLVKKYPAQAPSVYYWAKKSTNEAKSRYKSSTLNNGNGDAFRHALWNAGMTKAFSGGPSYDFTLGRKYAKLWRDAHENFAENPALAKTMDLYNNNVGQNVVTKSTYSTAQLITACMNKVTKGQCKRYNSAGNALIKTDGKGRI